MRLNHLLSSLVVALIVGLSSSAWAGGWSVFGPVSSSGIGGLRAAESWINGTCKPDQIGDVTSFFSQNGRSQPYNIYVFCKQGSGSAPITVTATEYVFNQGGFDPQSFINTALQGRSVSIIGIFAGVQNEIFF